MSDWMSRWDDFRRQADPYHPRTRIDDFKGSTFISLKHNYFHASSPKVGCSTIKKILIQAELGQLTEFDDFQYIHYREFHPLLSIQQIGNVEAFLSRRDIYKFCFVRNPYTRLLSAYLDKIAKNKGEKWQLLVQNGYGAYADHHFSFEEFVNSIIDQPVMYMDQHWRIQYFMTYQERIKYDFIGRFEQFEEDLKNVLIQVNIDPDTYYSSVKPHQTKADLLIHQYYTKALLDKVYQKYQIDFKHFGYSKEIT